ncbi:hypothetical protein Tco_0038756 [Tanacetum coccineum]
MELCKPKNLMKSIESFLKKFNRISFGKTPKVLLHAWDNFIEAKHAQPEEVQELLSKLVQDVKIISDELSEYINTPLESPSRLLDDMMTRTIPLQSTRYINEEPSSVEILVPIPSESAGVPKVCDVPFHDNSPPLDISKDQSEDFSDSNVDSTSTDEDYSLEKRCRVMLGINGGWTPPNSEAVRLRVMEIVIPEVGRLRMTFFLMQRHTLRENIVIVNRLVAKIEALKDNPVPSSVVMTKSTSTFSNLLLEETNTFDNSLPELETFCFNLEEPSSGSPTTHSELSLPDYKAFYIDNDHFKEKSSGSTTTHVDFSQYDSFIFDLSINSYHPSNRSDFHEEFTDELAQIISHQVDCFFKDEPYWQFSQWMWWEIFSKQRTKIHVLNVLPTLDRFHTF